MKHLKSLPQQDREYLTLLNDIMNEGVEKGDRTGTGTRSLFGTRMKFDITEGKVPLLNTAKVFHKGIIHELIWMLSGDTNIRYLKENNVNIWDSWIDPATAEYEDINLHELGETLAQKIGNDRARGPEEILTLCDENDIPTKKLIAGDLPFIYQHQWRKWDDIRILPHGVSAIPYEARGYKVVAFLADTTVIERQFDQVSEIVNRLKTNGDCRRIILSAWNAAQIEDMALAPCHAFVQFWSRELDADERYGMLSEEQKNNEPGYEIDDHTWLDDLGIPRRALSCQLYQRSADFPLGVKFNIVFYALFTHMLAQVTGMIAEEFIWVGGDTHVYDNQHDGVEEHLSRADDEASVGRGQARVELNPTIDDIFEFTFDDVRIVDYDPMPTVNYPAAAV